MREDQDEVGLGSSHEHNEKCLNSADILKMKLNNAADGLDMECEGSSMAPCFLSK